MSEQKGSITLEDLKPASYNPRTIDVKALTGLKVSLETFGDISGLVYNRRTGNLVAGHQRFKALQEEHGDDLDFHHSTDTEGLLSVKGAPDDHEGWKVRIVDWPLDKEMAANVAANATTIEGEFTEGLGEVLDVIQEDQGALYDALRFSELIVPNVAPKAGSTGEDDVPEVPVRPFVKIGDLWICGKHRVLCGSATSSEDIARVVGPDRAEAVITDPPYGIGTVGSQGTAGNFPGTSAPRFKARPIVGDESTFDPAHLLSIASKIILWGANHYASRLPDASGWIVWDKKVDAFKKSDLGDAEVAWTNLGGAMRIHRQTWQGMYRAGVGERSPRVHPTQKPVDLMGYCVERTGAKTIIDPYLGSGSTVIACERLGVRCYGVEIEPQYVEVALQRWAEFTEKDPVRHDGVGFTALKAKEKEAATA